MDTKTTLTEATERTGEGISFLKLSELEDQTAQIMALTDQIKSLLYFMGNFFSAESIEPNTKDRDAHERAVLNIHYYPHYRELFGVINQNAEDLKENAESALHYVESLFDLIKRQ